MAEMSWEMNRGVEACVDVSKWNTSGEGARGAAREGRGIGVPSQV